MIIKQEIFGKVWKSLEGNSQANTEKRDYERLSAGIRSLFISHPTSARYPSLAFQKAQGQCQHVHKTCPKSPLALATSTDRYRLNHTQTDRSQELFYFHRLSQMSARVEVYHFLSRRRHTSLTRCRPQQDLSKHHVPRSARPH